MDGLGALDLGVGVAMSAVLGPLVLTDTGLRSSRRWRSTGRALVVLEFSLGVGTGLAAATPYLFRLASGAVGRDQKGDVPRRWGSCAWGTGKDCSVTHGALVDHLF